MDPHEARTPQHEARKTRPRIGIRAAARRWAEYLVAILIGNIVYLYLEPQFPPAMRHRIFQIDPGLAIDLAFCVAAYGGVRLIGGMAGHSK